MRESVFELGKPRSHRISRSFQSHTILLVCAVSISLIVCRCLAQDLEEIQNSVEDMFRLVDSLHVVVRLNNPNVADPNQDAEASTYYYEWALTEDGKLRRARTSPRYNEPAQGAYPELAPEAFTDIAVFNGKEGRAIVYSLEDYSQQSGSILASDGVFERLVERPPHEGEFGRAMGWLVNGLSLPDWLRKPSARVEGVSSIAGEECIIINVEERYKFYLASQKSYAMKRFESIGPSQSVEFMIENTELLEIEPGLWLPTAGQIDAFGRQVGPYPPLKPYDFEVYTLSVNEVLPPELFEIEFEDGLRVVDYRFNLILSWNNGIIDFLAGGFPDLGMLPDVYEGLPILTEPEVSEAVIPSSVSVIGESEGKSERTASRNSWFSALVGLVAICIMFAFLYHYRFRSHRH